MPTSQGALTDKIQVRKTSSESSALIKDLLSVVIVVRHKKQGNWCLRKGTGMGVSPEKVRGPHWFEPELFGSPFWQVHRASMSLEPAFPVLCHYTLSELPHHCQADLIKSCWRRIAGFYFPCKLLCNLHLCKQIIFSDFDYYKYSPSPLCPCLFLVRSSFELS